MPNISWITGGLVDIKLSNAALNYPTQKQIDFTPVDIVHPVYGMAFPEKTVFFAIADWNSASGTVDTLRKFYYILPGETQANYLVSWRITGEIINGDAKPPSFSFVLRDGYIHAISTSTQLTTLTTQIYYGKLDLRTRVEPYGIQDFVSTLIYTGPEWVVASLINPDIDAHPDNTISRLCLVWTGQDANYDTTIFKVWIKETGLIGNVLSETVVGDDFSGERVSILWADGNNVFVHSGTQSSTGSTSMLWKGDFLTDFIDFNNPLCSPNMPNAQISKSPQGILGLLRITSNALVYREWDGLTLSDQETIHTNTGWDIDGHFHYGLTCVKGEFGDYSWFAFTYDALTQLVILRFQKAADVADATWVYVGTCLDEINYPLGGHYYFACQNNALNRHPGCPEYFGLFTILFDGTTPWSLAYRHNDDLTEPPPPPPPSGSEDNYYEDGYVQSAQAFDVSIENLAFARRGDTVGGNIFRIMDWVELADGSILFADASKFYRIRKDLFTYQDLAIISQLKTKLEPFDSARKICVRVRANFDTEADLTLAVNNESENSKVVTLDEDTDGGVWKRINLNGRRFYKLITHTDNADFELGDLETEYMQTQDQN